MLRKASLFLYAIFIAAVVAWKLVDIRASYHSSGKVISVELTRGPFDLLYFPSEKPETRAIILFGSGDGGWSGFEEEVSQALQRNGYEVIGIDSDNYANTDYSLAILQADYGRIAERAEVPFGAHPPPLIIGGWSMGAEQAIAAAGGPNPPKGLAGLLVLDPCERGRYGVRLSDQVDLLPTGPNTFSMDEFAGTMGSLRVAQWHAAEDSIDSRKWLDSLTAPHREFDFENSGHYYNNNRDDFLTRLINSVPWILNEDHAAVTTTGSKP
jgi:phosphatidylglycerol lysyltransferase